MSSLPLNSPTSSSPPLPPRDVNSWFRAFQDVQREHGFQPLKVEGTIPPDLNGTLFRNGPGLFSNFGQGYKHWFDGDGAIAAVRLAEGQAQGAHRIIQSEGLLKEREKGRALYAGYGTLPPFWRRRPMHPVKNTGNTALMHHGGRLFALWEGGLPTEVDPETLETLGEQDFEGVILQSFSAHPRHVAQRKSSYNFGIRMGRVKQLDLYALPDGGGCKPMGTLPMPKGSMIHDFAATPNYLIFFLAPVKLNIAAQVLSLGAFGNNLSWHPAQGTEILIVPIDDPQDHTHFTTDAFWSWHIANAFEREGSIIIEYVHYPDFSSNAWLGSIAQGDPCPVTLGTFNRARISAKGRRFKTGTLFEGAVEFPRIAPHLGGDLHRYTWLAHQSAPLAEIGSLQDSLVRVDGHSGEVEVHTLSGNQWVGEPVFVPRAGATEEDDGYVLSLVYDADDDLSRLHIYPAHALGDGPLAKVHFDHPIPLGFHGVYHPQGEVR